MPLHVSNKKVYQGIFFGKRTGLVSTYFLSAVSIIY